MAWHPHLTVATIVEYENKYLLVKELSKRTRQLVLNQPAGHVEANETLIDAAVRETLEETGYDVKVTGLIGIYSFTPPDQPSNDWMTYYRFCFKAELTSLQAAKELDKDIIEAVWLTWEEINELKNLRSPLVKQCIEDARTGKSFPLEIINEYYLFADKYSREDFLP